MPAMNLNIALAPTVRAEGVRSKMDGSTFALKWNSSGCTGQVFSSTSTLKGFSYNNNSFFAHWQTSFNTNAINKFKVQSTKKNSYLT